MTRQFLRETGDAEGRVLTTGGVPVHDDWGQLQSYLGSAFGPEYAALLAEPYKRAGTTAWMHEMAATAVPLSSLSSAEQDAMRARLGEMVRQIDTVAEQKRSAPSPSERHWGGLLENALRFPSNSNLGDNVYCAGQQPILLRWGMRDESSLSLAQMLRAPVSPPPPPIDEVRQVVVPTTPAPPERRGFLWMPWLVWLLWGLVGLLLLLLALLFFRPAFLPSFSLPGFGKWGVTPAVQTANDEHSRLLERLRMTQQKAASIADCAPVVPPQPAVPPAPAQSTTTQETRLDQAREQASGQLGDVTVTLAWNGKSDLDLVFQCPDGGLSAKNNERNGGVCGGVVDVDANFCSRRSPDIAGGVCRSYKTGSTDTPVENGFFMRSKADKGATTVIVRYYAADAAAPRASVPYELQVRIGDERRTFPGVIEPGQMSAVTSFNID